MVTSVAIGRIYAMHAMHVVVFIWAIFLCFLLSFGVINDVDDDDNNADGLAAGEVADRKS